MVEVWGFMIDDNRRKFDLRNSLQDNFNKRHRKMNKRFYNSEACAITMDFFGRVDTNKEVFKIHNFARRPRIRSKRVRDHIEFAIKDMEG